MRSSYWRQQRHRKATAAVVDRRGHSVVIGMQEPSPRPKQGPQRGDGGRARCAYGSGDLSSVRTFADSVGSCRSAGEQRRGVRLTSLPRTGGTAPKAHMGIKPSCHFALERAMIGNNSPTGVISVVGDAMVRPPQFSKT